MDEGKIDQVVFSNINWISRSEFQFTSWVYNKANQNMAQYTSRNVEQNMHQLYYINHHVND